MAKRVVKKAKPKVKTVELPKVKKLVLKSDEVAQIILPPRHVPALVADPSEQKLEIVPVPAKKKRTWWQSIFGD